MLCAVRVTHRMRTVHAVICESRISCATAATMQPPESPVRAEIDFLGSRGPRRPCSHLSDTHPCGKGEWPSAWPYRSCAIRVVWAPKVEGVGSGHRRSRRWRCIYVHMHIYTYAYMHRPGAEGRGSRVRAPKVEEMEMHMHMHMHICIYACHGHARAENRGFEIFRKPRIEN